MLLAQNLKHMIKYICLKPYFDILSEYGFLQKQAYVPLLQDYPTL